MKLKFLLLVGFLAIASSAAFAQDFSDPRFANYGATPEIRKENITKYNYLRDAYSLKQYDVAAGYLNELLKDAPKASLNLYIMGSTIYKRKIAAAKTPEEKNAYVDTLFRIYDVRSANFGTHATRGIKYISNEKAKDAIAYIPSDVEKLNELVNDALEKNEGKQDLTLMQGYFNLLVEGYMSDKIEADLLLNQYDHLSTYLEKDGGADKNATREVIDQLFIQSGAASCENLEKIYKPQFEANSSDKELVRKIARYLVQQECASEFRDVVSEAYYKLEPSAAAAIALATTAQQAKDYERAFKFYDEAISLEEDATTRSTFQLSAAGTALLAENARLAATYARASIEAKASNQGLAYFILAQAQAQGLAGCSGFDKQAGYWVVVDNLLKAKSLLEEGDPTLENVNKSIYSYSAGFPSAEEVFFRTLTPGKSYTVNCGWVSGTTIIREKK